MNCTAQNVKPLSDISLHSSFVFSSPIGTLAKAKIIENKMESILCSARIAQRTWNTLANTDWGIQHSWSEKKERVRFKRIIILIFNLLLKT